MEKIKILELFPLTRIQAAETAYSSLVPITNFNELILFLEVTAQGAFTNETLNVTVQYTSPSGQVYDLLSFTQVGDVTAILPYGELKGKTTDFGPQIRIKRETAGTSVDYTFRVTGYAKRN